MQIGFYRDTRGQKRSQVNINNAYLTSGEATCDDNGYV